MTYNVVFGTRTIEAPAGQDELDWDPFRRTIENRVAQIIQAESLCLLLGSGFTQSVAVGLGASAQGMLPFPIAEEMPFRDQVLAHVEQSAQASGRGEANFEDQINSALTLSQGLGISGDPAATQWREWVDVALRTLVAQILRSEGAIQERVVAAAAHDSDPALQKAFGAAGAFLWSFANRRPSRERLHVFTTNYDRVIEFIADSVGLRILDRFSGTLRPRLQPSRASLDYIWNPPGLRGEPRFVEGVVRLTKLHGSIDWRDTGSAIVRVPLEFGAPDAFVDDVSRELMVYPNSAKDRALREYPYSELFRDLASAAIRNHTAVVTYGYGFGDAHINEVLRDVLRIPSSLLLIISYNDPGGRIERFVAESGARGQITVLVGEEFGDLGRLTSSYLPALPEDALQSIDSMPQTVSSPDTSGQ